MTPGTINKIRPTRTDDVYFKKAKKGLITTHTGRRTFATELLLKGVDAGMVMQFTGHKDYKSFSSYVNIPKQTQMNIVRNALLGSTMKIA